MKKKGLQFAICAIILVVTFFFLNNIVAAFFPREYALRKINFEDYKDAGQAYTKMAQIQISEGDLKECITCTGWVFAETNEDNSSKVGNLILKGRKNTYITSDFTFSISSVQSETAGWKEIQGPNHNFSSTFSTVILPPDIYEIYVYVEENENARGIVDTGCGFRKNGILMDSFTEVEFCDVPDISEISSIFDNGWWTTYFEDSYIEVTGWQVKDEITSENFTYYAAFVGDNGEVLSFRMPSINHTVLAQQLGSTKYITSGFTGCFDYADLPDVQGLKYIVAECNGQWYRTEESRYEIPQE